MAQSSAGWGRSVGRSHDPLGLAPTACQLNAQGKYPGDKTHAFTGYDQFQSGWADPSPGRYSHTAPQDVIANSNGNPFNTHNFDGGVPGQYNASHAELQAWHADPGNPIVVSRPMCNSCRPQFQNLADGNNTTIHVGDSASTRTATRITCSRTTLARTCTPRARAAGTTRRVCSATTRRRGGASGQTHIGPSNGTMDTIDGKNSRVPRKDPY
jgi:hypothetical protein